MGLLKQEDTMNQWDIQDADRELRSAQRKKKWKERETKFWKAFLFTEDGKPKSGFVLYTFCLSFVFLAFYLLAFLFLVDGLQPYVRELPVLAGNLVTSLACSLVGVALSWVVHLLMKDKRLMLGGHIWLCIYAAACMIYMMLLLRQKEAIQAFLVFYAWFVLVPVSLGTVCAALLYRKDYTPKVRPAQEQPWQKYVNRR
ncbi:MAG: hypothetical protein Q4F17_01275 [Eubacteriales bacterium]|nr:hypothetical protein [Eubacteriales bacterium]